MSAALVALFAPYCHGAPGASLIDAALQLLALGQLEGQRCLRPQGERPFTLRWQPGVAPLELAQVQLEVRSAESSPAVHYRFELPTHQLLSWLIEWQAAAQGPGGSADLPESFWQWLILGLDPTALRT